MKTLVAIGLVVCSTVAAGEIASFSSRTSRQSQARGSHGLAKHDRTRLVELRVARKPDVSVLVAAAPGKVGAVAQAVQDAGGFVIFRADEAGYLRAVVPVFRIESLAALPAVEALNIDTGQFYFSGAQVPDPKSEGRAPTPSSDTERASIPPPSQSTPAENGYLATKDIGMPAFLRAHPEFDGRGITIGVIECCPDALHPVLKNARDAKGGAVRKVGRILAAGDFEKLGWNVTMRDEVQVRGRRFLYRGGIYTAPLDGRFRIGVKSADEANIYFAPRNPPPITILWDVASGAFWLDTNNDHDFSDEKPLRDFNESGQAVPLRWEEEIAKANYLTGSLAVVVLDAAAGRILLAPSGMHATAVSGGAAGHSLYGGSATGSAPGARILPVWTGLTPAGGIEAFIAAASHPEVDVLSSSNAFEMRMRDGHSVWSIVANRLVDAHGKAIFGAAGNNGPGISSGNEAAAAAGIVKVGGYVGRETWLTNFGLVGDRDGYVGFSATRGPLSDGGENPSLIAPICAVAPSGVGAKNAENDGLWSGKPLYTNPPGYESNCGTSFAAPISAGAAAALISAAKSAGVPHDADRIRWALAAGATFLPGYQAHEQGAGLVNVAAAWKNLRTAPDPVSIRGEAPVRTTTSAYLAAPGRGTGLYEREGWTAGQTGERTITLTRTSGPRETTAYRLAWLGNDGTFAAPASVRLPLDQGVAVKVRIAPRTAGVHSALLRVMNADGVTPTHEMLATVVAAERLTAGNGYSVSREATVPWLGTSSTFVEVPKGAGSLDVVVKSSTEAVRLFLYDPAGERYPAAFAKLFVPPDVVRGQTSWNASGELRRSIPRPEPGVWEIIVEHNGYSRVAERFKAQNDASAAVAVSVGGIRSSPGADSCRGGAACTLSVESALAAFEGRAVAIGVASASKESLTLTSGEWMVERPIKVEADAKRLAVRIRTADSAADVDLHLFDCTQGSCERRESVVFRAAEKELTVEKPAAGEWRAVVAAHALRSGSVAVEYANALVVPKYGELKLTDAPSRREPGAAWTVEAKVAGGDAAPEKRSRMAVIDVVSEKDQAPVGMFWGQPGPDTPLGPSVFGTVWVPLPPPAEKAATGGR